METYTIKLCIWVVFYFLILEGITGEKLKKLDLWVPSLNEKGIETYRKKTEQRKKKGTGTSLIN